MTEIKFFQLPPDTIDPLWHIIPPRIKSGVERSSGRLTEDSLHTFLITGQWQCWAAWEGTRFLAVIITRLRVDPSGIKVLDAVIATGDDREKWQQLSADTLEQFAKDEDCSIFEMWARPGWERVFTAEHGWKKTHVLLEKRI